ncbi:MAG: NAD(P)/FAD-dependent oxidoreductase [Halobacteriota archaeon]
MTDQDVDLVVVGGGVTGCAIARSVAPDLDVLVLERDKIATGGATALAAGEVTMTPSYSDVPSIANHAMAFFRDYDGTGAFSFHERPSVELVPSDREGEARRRADRLSEAGFPVSFREPSTVGTDHPRLSLDEYAGVVRHEDTGFLDPYTLTVELQNDAEDRGGTVETGRTVTDVRVEDGAVAGVRTETGRIDADQVVVAAGWRTRDLLEGVLELPIRPYRTQVVVLEPKPPMDDSFPMGWIPGRHVYFRPEVNGDLVVGGYSFAEDHPERASGQEDEEFRDHVASLVPTFLDDFDRAGFVDGWAGIDAATPDTRPIVDAPDDGPDGLVVATGFHGRGVMTAPVTATVARELVLDEEASIPHDPFALDRFESRSADFPFYSISSGDDEYED